MTNSVTINNMIESNEVHQVMWVCQIEFQRTGHISKTCLGQHLQTKTVNKGVGSKVEFCSR